MICGYRQHGKEFFSHKNKGRKPVSALTSEFKDNILLLYTNKYSGANLSHFTELPALHEDIHISEGTVRNILLENHILSPKAWRRTRKAPAKQLREKAEASSSVKEKKLLQAAIVAAQDAHPTRERCAYAGEMVQMDASLHLWFGDSKTQLHAAIDDATGLIPGAYFDYQETLKGYYNVFKQIPANYGIPYMFYTDRRTVFEYKKKNSTDVEKDTFTQFSYACNQLGVALNVTSVPQAKGRIERLFGTLQSRLPVEMRPAGIKTIEQANEFLTNYVKKFNAQFALAFNDTTSVFEVQPELEKINLILSVLMPRVVDSGHSIRYNNLKYRLLDEQGTRVNYYKGTKAMVIRTLDDKLYCSIGENI